MLGSLLYRSAMKLTSSGTISLRHSADRHSSSECLDIQLYGRASVKTRDMRGCMSPAARVGSGSVGRPACPFWCSDRRGYHGVIECHQTIQQIRQLRERAGVDGPRTRTRDQQHAARRTTGRHTSADVLQWTLLVTGIDGCQPYTSRCRNQNTTVLCGRSRRVTDWPRMGTFEHLRASHTQASYADWVFVVPRITETQHVN